MQADPRGPGQGRRAVAAGQPRRNGARRPRPDRLQADLRWIDHTAARLDLLARRAGERALEELVAGHEVLFAEETAGGCVGLAGVETGGGAG